MHCLGRVSTQQSTLGEESITLHLTYRAAALLEAQLARDVARIEDQLVEGGDGSSMLAEDVAELRGLVQRLRQLLEEQPMSGAV